MLSIQDVLFIFFQISIEDTEKVQVTFVIVTFQSYTRVYEGCEYYKGST